MRDLWSNPVNQLENISFRAIHQLPQSPDLQAADSPECAHAGLNHVSPISKEPGREGALDARGRGGGGGGGGGGDGGEGGSGVLGVGGDGNDQVAHGMGGDGGLAGRGDARLDARVHGGYRGDGRARSNSVAWLAGAHTSCILATHLSKVPLTSSWHVSTRMRTR